ncbi:MAG: RICIN domain-containing protein [Anaerolineae bacterium]|nr:RICIN domain-containing protein [Anaerolineae bacterium]
MDINEGKTYLGKHFSVVSQAGILRLVFLLFGLSLAACQTAATQLREPSPAGEVESPLATTAAPASTSDPVLVAGLIQLQDPLDEPEYYCVDVPGAGASLNLGGALQAHTCKLRAAEDETFTLNYPSVGHIYMEAYDLCVEADNAVAGAELRLQECADQPLQKFVYQEGQIRLGEASAETLCLAVAPGEGTPTGGPSHLRRDLGLQLCDKIEAELSEWVIQ